MALRQASDGLQWGRDSMATERERSRGLHGSGLGFNGAVTLWPRKEISSLFVCNGSIGFNGAVTLWPRKGRVEISDWWLGFNGAVTLWPRKDVGFCRTASTSELASMGP